MIAKKQMGGGEGEGVKEGEERIEERAFFASIKLGSEEKVDLQQKKIK